MNHIIKVNGFIIDPTKVAMLDRKTVRLDNKDETGILMHFSAGGKKWVADPEAKMVEQAFMEYDFGKREDYLPY